MHPLVHITSLVIFSLGLALGQLSDLWLAALFLPLYWLFCGHGPGASSWQMLRRLRWFFFSILAIYLWFTPGQWIWPALQQWSPTYDGLWLALHRLLVLVAIVLAVATLLKALSMGQLMSALRQLLQPLRLVGFPVDRFALRLTLTVDASQRLLLQPAAGQSSEEKKTLQQRLSGVADVLYQRFKQTMQLPEKEVEIELEAVSAPPPWQWLWPATILLAFVFWN